MLLDSRILVSWKEKEEKERKTCVCVRVWEREKEREHLKHDIFLFYIICIEKYFKTKSHIENFWLFVMLGVRFLERKILHPKKILSLRNVGAADL